MDTTSANDAMTFGLAHRWRKQLVKWSGVKAGDKVLDCATGTGDLAIEFKKPSARKAEVTGTDFCAAMLEKAPPKAERRELKIDFQLADAMNLPFADGIFDIASMAYGIRNVSDPQKAVSQDGPRIKTRRPRDDFRNRRCSGKRT